MSAESNTHTALPTIKLPIIVEGRYDKSAILGMFSATVVTTDGFGVFNSKQKQMPQALEAVQVVAVVRCHL